MFCPNCGKSDQKEITYCRQCGEFIPDLSPKNKQALGGNTPEDQINTNLILSLMTATVSYILAIILFVSYGWRNPEAGLIIYIVVAFLFAIGSWQISNYTVGLKLKKYFEKRKETEIVKTTQEPDKQFQAAETRELLNEADQSNAVPIGGVTENTTTKLKVKSE